MIDISRGKASEFDEIIDFIDFVFSKANCPHDFPTMYPNLYRRTDESMNNLINLREDGVIKASVLCYPRTMVIGGERLKVYGIGSVATHPRFKGRGFMTTLMNYTVREMKKEGVHMSNLGGKRSRYNHFGYEITGNSYGADLSLESLKTSLPSFPADKYTFKALSYEDRDVICACKAIYDKKPVHYEYDYDDFYLRMYRKNGSTPYAVYGGDKLLGFLAMNVPEGMRNVKEICLANETLMSEVLFAFMLQNNVGLRLRFSESQLPFLRPYLDISGDISRSGNSMWSILRWKEVVSALMTYKAQYAALEPGKLVCGIENAGRLAVSFDSNGIASVTDTDEKADFVFKGLSAARAFFGPAPEAIFGIGNTRDKNTLIKSWFPLPLTWFSTESV